MCRESVIYDESGDGRSLVGEVAHIVGDKPGAARGVSSLTQAERDAPANLMLLCRKHHKIIDDNEAEYDVGRLHTIRKEYLAWLAAQLAPTQRWRINVSSLSFLNVPRLGEYAERHGLHLARNQPPPGQSLHEMGYALNELTNAYRRTLESIFFESVAAGQIMFAHEDYVGQLISFDRVRFRTRNIPEQRPAGGLPFPFTGNLERDPHIYHPFPSWTLVLNIDPNWITQTTAYGLFRPSGGHSIFSGLARITAVDLETGVVIATALAIGQPDGPPRDKPAANSLQTDLRPLEDDVTRSRAETWRGDIERCDFCGKPFADESYMVDGPTRPGGRWGCMCAGCYAVGRLPIGVGKGQLYRREGEVWRLVGGYPRILEPQASDDSEF